MKHTKKALLASALSMLLCVSMLVGSTFAWFTDSVTSGQNKIVAGNLDIELEYAKAIPGDGGALKLSEWKPVTGDTADLFGVVDGTKSLWEPGHTEVVYLRVTNKGSLALKYKLAVAVAKETTSVSAKDGGTLRLSDYLVFGQEISKVEPTPYTDREAAQKAAGDTKKLSDYEESGVLLSDSCEYVSLVVYMPEEVGNEANYQTGKTAPSIDLSINLTATQTPYESDSFDENYDKDAQPEDDEIVAGEISENVPTEGEVSFDFGDGAVQVTVPADDIADDTEKITLSVRETSLPAGIACDEGNGDGSKSYTISVTPLMDTLPSPITVKVYIGDWYQTADAYINRVEVGDHVTQEHAAGISLTSADDAAEDVTFKDGYVTFSTKEVGTFSIVGHGFKYSTPRYTTGAVITGLGNIEVGEDGVLTIPDTIAGKNVVEIAQFAFFDGDINIENEEFDKVKEVHLGKYVEDIGNRAFCGLKNLEKIYIPASVDHFALYVFEYCANLKEVHFEKTDNWIRTGTVLPGGRPTGGTPVDPTILSDPLTAGEYMRTTNEPSMYRISD